MKNTTDQAISERTLQKMVNRNHRISDRRWWQVLQRVYRTIGLTERLFIPPRVELFPEQKKTITNLLGES